MFSIRGVKQDSTFVHLPRTCDSNTMIDDIVIIDKLKKKNKALFVVLTDFSL